MSIFIEKYASARDLAERAHRTQLRKYTGEPYINHCFEVADLVRAHRGSDDAVIAAVLHDTVEDTPVTLGDVCRGFGDRIARSVYYLTAPPFWGFAEKETVADIKARHVASCPDFEVLLIKCADIISNCSTIRERDPLYAPSYLAEKLHTLRMMEIFPTGQAGQLRSHPLFKAAYDTVIRP